MRIKECDYYMDGKCRCDFEDWNGEIISYPDCKDVKDCCYKQLKLKEQECEQYKKEINRLNKSGYCYAYEKGCHEICKQQNCIIKNGYKYKQALDKIEEICNSIYSNGLDEEVDKFDDILNIINKGKEH